MKRTLLAGALAVVLVAEGAVLLWNQKKASRLSAAELVPPETLLMAECPDIPTTALRWKATALHDIMAEPELRAFFSRPIEGGLGELAGADWKRIRPRQAFLAVTSFADNRPQAIAGLEFDGERGELEPIIARAMIGAQNASPRGKMTRLKYRGYSIIVFKDNGITVAGCGAKHWYFVGNDVDVLKGTLDRFLDKGHMTLALSPKFQASYAALPVQSDVRLFTQPTGGGNRVLAGLGAESVGLPRVRFDTAALSMRFEGRLIHDTIWLRQRASYVRPRLDGRTLALATPETVFYGAMAPQLENWFPASGSDGQPGPGRLIPTLLSGLAPGGASRLIHYQAAFGPEHALFLHWPESNPQPGLFLASEIRDAAQARRFMENLFRSWDRVDDAGVLTWTLSLARPALFHPAVALAGSHLVAGLSSESLRPFAIHASTASGTGPALERSPGFRTSLAPLAKPETGLAYLDAAVFFERLYGALQPAAALWGASLPWLNQYADFGRLPSAQTVSKHLSPIGLTARQTQEGVIIDTAGPVSFVEVSAALGAAAFYTLLPSIRAKEPPTPGIAPPPPLKPLSQPAPAGP